MPSVSYSPENSNGSHRKGKKGLSALLPPRDFLVRRNGEVGYFTLTTRMQVFLVLFFALCGGWMVYSSVFFVRYDKTAAFKSEQIASLRVAYRNLLDDVAAYGSRFSELSDDLDENHRAIMALNAGVSGGKAEGTVKKIAELEKDGGENARFAKELERLERDRDRLKSEMAYVRGRLASVFEEPALRDVRPETDEISYRTALLQRDLAVSESAELKKRVRGLEDLIAKMQDAQILAFQKMTSVAEENISGIEEVLSGVSETLKTAGLGMNSLLNRIRRDKETAGIGGPFIPAAMPKIPNSNLHISLASLNTRLDRWFDLTVLQDALPLGKPIERIRVSSPFGAREDPFQGMPARHEAVDLKGITGEPVYTRAPGKVVRAGMWGWYGNMVEIDHGMGFRTRYAHLDKIFVRKGETVRSGDRIGNVGSTGRSTGAHLHYEIRVRGHAVDPMNFIKAKKNVFKGS